MHQGVQTGLSLSPSLPGGRHTFPYAGRRWFFCSEHDAFRTLGCLLSQGRSIRTESSPELAYCSHSPILNDLARQAVT